MQSSGFETLCTNQEDYMDSRIILGILSAIIGLLAIINPQASIEVIVILIGISAIVSGIHSILKAKEISSSPYFVRTVTARSIAGIIIGLFAVILPFALFSLIEKVIRIFLYIQGFYLLLSAVSEFIMIFRLKDSVANVKPFVIEAFCTLFLAILLFMLPADFGVKIVRIAGAVIFISGLLFAFREWKMRPIEAEAEIKE